MKWVAIVILLIIGPYTFLRWHYRKPGPAFQPYHDMKNQANTERLLSAGFQRITLQTDRPIDPLRNVVNTSVKTTLGGFPSVLVSSLIEKPVLPAEILTVAASAESNTLFPYAIEFTSRQLDNNQQVGSAYLYLRDEQIHILPDCEALTGSLLARTRENLIRVTVPAGALKPGSYDVTLIGEHSSKSWTLVVK